MGISRRKNSLWIRLWFPPKQQVSYALCSCFMNVTCYPLRHLLLIINGHGFLSIWTRFSLVIYLVIVTFFHSVEGHIMLYYPSFFIPFFFPGSRWHLTDFPKSWSQFTQLLVEKRLILLLTQWGDCSSNVSYLCTVMSVLLLVFRFFLEICHVQCPVQLCWLQDYILFSE